MREYGIYVIIIALVSLLALFDPISTTYLRFDRELIDSGQFWRLFSAHFVHLSNTHLLGNVFAVCLVAYIAGRSFNNVAGLLLLLWCVFFVGFGLYFFAADLSYYVGLSGALHGLLIVAPFVSVFYGRKIAYVFLLAITLKVIWEQTPFYDDLALADVIGGRVEARAHLFGWFAGIIYLPVWFLWHHYFKKKVVFWYE